VNVTRFLLLRFEAPLLAFGGETVDARGVIADFPSRSLLTGLLANALGWRRGERHRLARLQERIAFAARIDREGERMTDFQTASIGGGDKGWTTRGRPEGRAGGTGTYNAPHIRRRDFDADASVTVALRLDPADEAPDLDAAAAALQEPARPLFLGRKSCPPAGSIFLRAVDAEDLQTALLRQPLSDPEGDPVRVLLPASEPGMEEDEVRFVTDERDWRSGVHAGARRVRLRSVPRLQFAVGGGA